MRVGFTESLRASDVAPVSVGAAWALRATSLGTPELVGLDINRWALTEAQATWKSVGLRGKTKLRQWSIFPKPRCRMRLSLVIQ